MKKKLIVIGAGGKMGFRVSRKLWTSEEYESYFCEISETGIARLEGLGIRQNWESSGEITRQNPKTKKRERTNGLINKIRLVVFYRMQTNQEGGSVYIF